MNEIILLIFQPREQYAAPDVRTREDGWMSAAESGNGSVKKTGRALARPVRRLKTCQHQLAFRAIGFD